jgi:membrane fusion protein (multidrug efflux system)
MTTRLLHHTNLPAGVIALVAASLIAPSTGCNKGDAGGPPPERATPVVIGKPLQMAVEETISAVGTVDANERVDIQPEVPGLIETILFNEGDRVRRDQQLFAMNSRSESAVVNQAKAELKLAQSNLDRARTLIDTKAISQQELDQLESQLAVRSAALNAAEQDLSERFIEAPFDGRVGPRRVSPGHHVSAGTSLVTLVDDSTVKVQFRIPERQLALIKPGQRARLAVAAWPDQVFEGIVDLIDPVVEQSTRTVDVRLLVPNDEHQLRPGMFARVAVVVQTREHSLVVPESALVPSLEAFSLYFVEDGRAHRRPVKLGIRLPGKVEVLDGLEADSEFVAGGLQMIVDGMKVVPAPDPTGTDAARN